MNCHLRSIFHTIVFITAILFSQFALRIAAGSGNYEIVKLLVKASSDMNATPKVNFITGCDIHCLV